MEYTQWESIFWQSKLCRCLNPCCNGIYSMSCTLLNFLMFQCLNPCCNGIYSMRRVAVFNDREDLLVLILVVMEYTQWAFQYMMLSRLQGLNPCCNGIYSMRSTQAERWRIRQLVLILVVMEYTQWEYPINNNKLWKYGLNPCCNGIYSMSKIVK